MLGTWDQSKADVDADDDSESEQPSDAQRRAFRGAMLSALILALGMAALAAVPGSPLRAATQVGEPSVNALGPFFQSIEVLIAALFFVPGVVFGVMRGKIRSDKDVARMTSDTMATMGAYIALSFAAAQFVAFFSWTELGAITAVKGANVLKAIGLGGIPLLLAFLLVSASMNMFVGSASAKWAFMAPIFVPMLMQMGFSPETVQATYRVGDSITNIITPLMPYLPIIIVFAKKYDRDAGLGTLMAAMVPYSIAFGIVWTITLGVWVGFDIPMGPGVPARYAP